MLLITAPILAGLIVLVFMFKPIFFSIVGSRATRFRSLTRAGEPELFELVDRICDTIRAPRPSRIQVDSEVNASASYGVGLRGIFKRQLVLTIGVPLVAGLSTRQFAGILAHEFGHFSQGAGMRAQLIIGAINLWFAKVVYQRDDIDEKLDEAIEDSESAFGFVLMFAKLCVYLVRGVLWCFMIAAHSISSIFSRQMEFDADRYEIALVGSETFAQTGKDLHLLGNAYGKSLMGVITLLKQAVFIDDLPRMIQLCRSQFTTQEIRTVTESIEQGKTGLLDTHPCTRERIAQAKKADVTGVFMLDTPARNLFRDYESLCNNVTQDFYRNLVGRNVQASEMKRVDEYIHTVLK